MPLTLTEISPYLPYQIRYQIGDKKPKIASILYEIGGDDPFRLTQFRDIKLCLRPMIDLISLQGINHYGQLIYPVDRIKAIDRSFEKISTSVSPPRGLHPNCLIYSKKYGEFHEKNLTELPYFAIEILFQYHFDVFGLLKRGLAIPIQEGYES